MPPPPPPDSLGTPVHVFVPGYILPQPSSQVSVGHLVIEHDESGTQGGIAIA